MEVRPSSAAAAAIVWSGEIEFRQGREDLTRCAFPAYGVIRLLPPDQSSFQVAFESDEESASIAFEIGDEFRYVCTPGEWAVGLAGETPQSVLVTAGAEVFVNLTDR